MEISPNFHDRVASLCMEHFKTLPKSGKPKVNEWTILSCVVSEHEGQLSVLALGTGSKCIGQNKMSYSGEILNDCHAEVICRRSFINFLYKIMRESNALITFNNETKKYSINKSAKFHFFTTHVPCGDSAIFLKQNSEDFGDVILENTNEEEVPTKKIKKEDIFRTGAKCLADDVKQDLKQPGSRYHVLGAVRTKPGRGNPTKSVSCSDKLTKWCHLGVQGALLSLLLEKPIYFSSFTVAAKTPFCKESLNRALYHRLGRIELKFPYFQNRMIIGQSSLEFEFSKNDFRQPCSTSISWCKIEGKTSEVAVEGKRLGVTKKNINTAGARLKICKIELFKNFIEICDMKQLKLSENCLIKNMTYRTVKMLSKDYQYCWNILKNKFKTWTCKDEALLNFCIK